MNTQEKPLFGSVEPEVVERIGAAARDALRKNRKLAVIGSVPILLAAASAEAFADGLPQQVVDVLNYALTLEHFEDSFYRKANGTDGLIPAKYRDLFREIGQHETGHVALLSGVLGSAAVNPRSSTSPQAASIPTCSRTSRRFRRCRPPLRTRALRPSRDRCRTSPDRPCFRLPCRSIQWRRDTPVPCACWSASPVRTAHSTNR